MKDLAKSQSGFFFILKLKIINVRIKKLKPKIKQEYKFEGNLSGHLIQILNLSDKGTEAQKSVTVQKNINKPAFPFPLQCLSCQFKTVQAITAFTVIQFRESFYTHIYGINFSIHRKQKISSNLLGLF